MINGGRGGFHFLLLTHIRGAGYELIYFEFPFDCVLPLNIKSLHRRQNGTASDDNRVAERKPLSCLELN